MSVTLSSSLSPSSTPPLGSAVHAVPIDPVVHVAPADPAVHIAPADPTVVLASAEVQLVMRTSSGCEYSFDSKKLSPAQLVRLNQIMANLAGSSSPFELNLTELISQADGEDGKFFSSEQSEIKELRELVKLSLGVDSLTWNTYLDDQRGCQSGDQLFACRGSVLTNLKIDDKDRLQALNALNLKTKQKHTPAEKVEILKRHKAGSELTEKTIAMLNRIKAGLEKAAPANSLQLVSEKASLDRTLDRFTFKTTKDLQKAQIEPEKHNALSIKNSAILLEALYPLDLSGMSEADKTTAIREKEVAIEKILKARPEERLEKKHFEPIFGFIPNPGKLVPFLRSSDSQFEREKRAFAQDVSLAGIDDKKDFHLHGNNSATGAELFFIKMQSLIARNAPESEIEACVNSSYFQAAFGSLKPHLREQAKNEMMAIAKNLRIVMQKVNVPLQDDSKALSQAFDAEYKTQAAAP